MGISDSSFAPTSPARGATLCYAANMNPTSMPQLRRSGEVTQLYVDGKPLLVLGGEL